MNRNSKTHVVESRHVSKKNRSNQTIFSQAKTNPGQVLPRGGREAVMVIPRSVNCVISDRVRTTLRYRTEVPINMSVVPQQGIRFQPSGAYDVDPSLGGSTMKGFLEFSQFFASYRVRSSYCKVQVVNPGLTTPFLLTLLPLNVDPGGSPTPLIVQDYREQPYAVCSLTALRGGPITTLEQSMTTQKMYGSNQVLYDNSFSSGVTAVPINNWYWAIGFDAPTVIPSSEGAVIAYVYVEIDLEFYDRKFLL